jgi:hypothetical protein
MMITFRLSASRPDALKGVSLMSHETLRHLRHNTNRREEETSGKPALRVTVS